MKPQIHKVPRKNPHGYVLFSLQQAFPVKFCTPCQHTSTRFSASTSICNIRLCSYVGIKVNNHTSFHFAKITFFFSKKGKIWGCEPIINTKKKKKEIYHVHVKVIRQIISHRNKASYQNWYFYQLRSQLQDFESRNTPWVKNHFVNEIHISWKTVITVVVLIRKENSNKRIPFSLRRCIKSQKIDWLV